MLSSNLIRLTQKFFKFCHFLGALPFQFDPDHLKVYATNSGKLRYFILVLMSNFGTYIYLPYKIIELRMQETYDLEQFNYLVIAFVCVVSSSILVTLLTWKTDEIAVLITSVFNFVQKISGSILKLSNLNYFKII